MNKKELITSTARQTCMLESEVRAVLDTAIDIITDRMQSGESVILRSFGVFKVRHKNVKTGYDFSRKRTIRIDECYKPVLVFNKDLIADINCANMNRKK